MIKLQADRAYPAMALACDSLQGVSVRVVAANGRRETLASVRETAPLPLGSSFAHFCG